MSTEKKTKVNLEKSSLEGPIDENELQITKLFSSLPKSFEVSKQIEDLVKKQKKEKFDRYSLEIKSTIEDSIRKNIPAVGFSSVHRDFMIENLPIFNKTFKSLGYLVWDFLDISTGHPVLYIIFDLEHFGMKDKYLQETTNSLHRDLLDETNNKDPIFSPRKGRFFS